MNFSTIEAAASSTSRLSYPWQKISRTSRGQGRAPSKYFLRSRRLNGSNSAHSSHGNGDNERVNIELSFAFRLFAVQPRISTIDRSVAGRRPILLGPPLSGGVKGRPIDDIFTENV